MNKPKLERCPFSEVVKVERERQGISLSELSKRCGVQKSSLSRYEHGMPPTLKNADKVLGALGLTMQIGAVSSAPLPDNKALTCDGCECEEGQSPSRCRRCMRYGDRTDNYRRPPEKGEL